MTTFDRFAIWLSKPANCNKAMAAFVAVFAVVLAMTAEGGLLAMVGM